MGDAEVREIYAWEPVAREVRPSQAAIDNMNADLDAYAKQTGCSGEYETREVFQYKLAYDELRFYLVRIYPDAVAA